MVTRRKRVVAGAIAFVSAGLLLALALLALGVFEGGKAVAGPKLSLNSDTVRLEIKLGESADRSVPFVNRGSEPLRVSIAKVRAAPDSVCGCGVTGREVRPEEVAPGAAGELVFSITAEGMTKPMKDKMLVDLESNDPSSPKRQITILLDMTTE